MIIDSHSILHLISPLFISNYNKIMMLVILSLGWRTFWKHSCRCSLHPRCCLIWYWWAHFTGQMTNQALCLSQQNRTASDCLRSVEVLFVHWDIFKLWPWQVYYRRSTHSFHKRYSSSELPRLDAWCQECADFKCGEWQPWWLSNCCSVVIENMLLSVGDPSPHF